MYFTSGSKCSCIFSSRCSFIWHFATQITHGRRSRQWTVGYNVFEGLCILWHSTSETNICAVLQRMPMVWAQSNCLSFILSGLPTYKLTFLMTSNTCIKSCYTGVTQNHFLSNPVGEMYPRITSCQVLLDSIFPDSLPVLLC